MKRTKPRMARAMHWLRSLRMRPDGGRLFVDRVSGRDVCGFIDANGTHWMAHHRFDIGGRVERRRPPHAHGDP